MCGANVSMPKMLCFDNFKDIRLAGSFDKDPTSQYVYIGFRKCQGKGCKSEEEIDEFLIKSNPSN